MLVHIIITIITYALYLSYNTSSSSNTNSKRRPWVPQPRTVKKRASHLYARLSVVDDHSVREVGGHDKVVLHNEGRLLRMQDEPLDQLRARDALEVERKEKNAPKKKKKKKGGLA